MRAGGPAAVLAASLICANGALAACPPGAARNCVNFDSVPQISQQIVAKEHVAPAAKHRHGSALHRHDGRGAEELDGARSHRRPSAGRLTDRGSRSSLGLGAAGRAGQERAFS
jgi:hypothetical protein